MIDKALRHVASEAEIARLLGVDQQRFWNWKTGRRSMPDDAIVTLATLAGIDPKACLGEYHFEWHEKKRGNALAGIAAAVVSVAASIAPFGDASASAIDSLATHYAKYFRRLRLLLRASLRTEARRQLRG
jgi:hypothetical protein